MSARFTSTSPTPDERAVRLRALPARALLAVITALALAASACGADDPVSTSEPDPASDSDASIPEPAAAAPGDLPDLEMTDLSTDASINLQSLADGSTPVLLWFWAPH